MPPRPRGHGELIGRLQTCSDAGPSRRSRTVLVSAPSGSGKSLLLRELDGRCNPCGAGAGGLGRFRGGPRPCFPWRSIWSSRWPATGWAPPRSSARWPRCERVRWTEKLVFETLAEALGALAKQSTLVVLVDDLDGAESLCGAVLRSAIFAEGAGDVVVVASATAPKPERWSSSVRPSASCCPRCRLPTCRAWWPGHQALHVGSRQRGQHEALGRTELDHRSGFGAPSRLGRSPTTTSPAPSAKIAERSAAPHSETRRHPNHRPGRPGVDCWPALRALGEGVRHQLLVHLTRSQRGQRALDGGGAPARRRPRELQMSPGIVAAPKPAEPPAPGPREPEERPLSSAAAATCRCRMDRSRAQCAEPRLRDRVRSSICRQSMSSPCPAGAAGRRTPYTRARNAARVAPCQDAAIELRHGRQPIE